MRRIFLLSQTILLFTFFNIALIILVFIHALGFEKHGNPYVVVLSHTPLMHRGYVDLPIMIGGSLPPAALTINESLLGHFTTPTPFFMFPRVLLRRVR